MNLEWQQLGLCSVHVIHTTKIGSVFLHELGGHTNFWPLKDGNFVYLETNNFLSYITLFHTSVFKKWRYNHLYQLVWCGSIHPTQV
jgi:hypothetical protein